MVEKAKVVAAFALGYGILLLGQVAFNWLLPVPEVLAQQPTLVEQLQQQDVSAAQWVNSAERLEEKLKLSRL